MSTETIGAVVKNLRKEKGLTLKDLSEKVDLSIGYLSQFERGITTIAVEYLVKIAETLEVPVTYFFNDPVSKEDIITRGYDQEILRVFNHNIYKSLSKSPSGKSMLPKLIEILPSSTTEHIASYPHHGEEFIYVLEGILTLAIDGTEHQLYPGDSAHYFSTKPHNWANYTNKLVKFLAVHTPSDL